MPVSKESKLAEYRVAFQEWRATMRTRLEDWRDAVREEPTLIWQTIAIRYSVYALGGFLALSALVWGLSLFHPPQVAPPAKTADFHVLCANPPCGKHFVINRRFGFDDFPVTCPACQQPTGLQAARCTSKLCAGRWVLTKLQGNEQRCTRCGEYLGKAD